MLVEKYGWQYKKTYLHRPVKILHFSLTPARFQKCLTYLKCFLHVIPVCIIVPWSLLVKTVFHAVNTVFLYRSGDPAKPRVLLLALTGVAVINTNANTVHSALHKPCRGRLFQLSDANKAKLRNKYSEAELVTIDEISMVSSKLFYQIHKRLNEILLWRPVSATTSSCKTCIYF